MEELRILGGKDRFQILAAVARFIHVPFGLDTRHTADLERLSFAIFRISQALAEGEGNIGNQVESKLLDYRQAARRGTDWLLGLMQDDGTLGPVQDRLYYYRVPWALGLMGEMGAASRKLDWIHRHMFSSDGAFVGQSPLGVFEQRYASYPLACLIVSAALLDRYDIVYPGTQHLLSWQDRETGGFYNNRRDRSAAGEQELFPTCQAGMTLLLVGQLQAARKAGLWVKRLWEIQPDVEHRLYSVYSREQSLVVDFPVDQSALYVTRKDDPWQYHFNGGIAAAFLSKLYMASGDSDWLELARQYQEFSMTTDPCQFQSMQVCKSGWGSGLLYMATRQQSYRDWTIRLGDWFLDQQRDDGHWENTHYWTPQPTVADNIEITAECVMHVAHIIEYLSVGERKEVGFAIPQPK